MQILPINDYQNSKNTNFKNMEITEAANSIIKKLKKTDFNFIEETKERLSTLNHWDLIIDKSKNWQEVFNIKFVNKYNKSLVYEQEIIPIRKEGNKVRISSTDEKAEDLIFPNEERAQALVDLYNKQLKIYEKNYISHPLQIPPILRIKNAADEIEFLDEAYEYMAKITPDLYNKATDTEAEIIKNTKKKPLLLRIMEKLIYIDD